MEVFCERIKFERKLKGYTQKQMAELLGIQQRTYAHYEEIGDMNRRPSFETVCKLAKIFDVSVDYLFGLVDL